MIKRLSTIILSAVLLLAVLLGCVSSSETPAEQQDEGTGSAPADQPASQDAEPGDKVPVTFWLRGNPDEALSKVIQEDIDLYNALPDGVATVSLEFVPISDFATKFNTAFAGGTAPDIMDTGVDQIAIRAHLQQYAPLDECIDSWDGKSKMLESCLNAGLMLDDGNTYGLAYAPHPCVFVWRKDFFEEAGLDPDTPPADWAEMLEFAEKLVVKDGDTVTRGGFALELTNHRVFTIMARQAGCLLYDGQNMPTIDDAAGIATMEYFQQIDPYSIQWNPPPGANVPRPFITSEAAMSYIAMEELQDMLNNNPALSDVIGVSDFVPMDASSPRSTWCGYRLYAINADSKVKDAAWDVIRFFMSEDRVLARMEDANIPPVYASMQESYEALNPATNRAALDAIAVGEPFPKTDWAQTFGETVNTATQEVLLGAKTPEQALQDAADIIKTDANL